MIIAVNFQFKQLERRSLKKSGLYFIVKTSIKLVGSFLSLIFFYYTFIKSFLPRFFLRKLLCNCYYKFQSMLQLVTVCRPYKAFIFYSGHPDVCTAIIIMVGTNQISTLLQEIILTLHEIKVLKIDATEIYANLVENLNDFQIKEINAKQRINFK